MNRKARLHPTRTNKRAKIPKRRRMRAAIRKRRTMRRRTPTRKRMLLPKNRIAKIESWHKEEQEATEVTEKIAFLFSVLSVTSCSLLRPLYRWAQTSEVSETSEVFFTPLTMRPGNDLS